MKVQLPGMSTLHLERQVTVMRYLQRKTQLTVLDLHPLTRPCLPWPHPNVLQGDLQLRLRLPKLTIRKFGGDLTKWVSFWVSFESAIHNNPTLTDIDKFNYLKSYLESIYCCCIAGLPLTAANYAEAIATLKRKFGNTQLIVNHIRHWCARKAC